jgi:hypothetical protein
MISNRYILHFPSDLEYIWYTKCTHIFIFLLQVSWRSAWWKVMLHLELKLISTIKFHISCPICVNTDQRELHVILRNFFEFCQNRDRESRTFLKDVAKIIYTNLPYIGIDSMKAMNVLVKSVYYVTSSNLFCVVRMSNSLFDSRQTRAAWCSENW